MVNDFSQDTDNLYPSYEDEDYWRYLMEEAEWHGKQEATAIFSLQSELDEKHMGMEKNTH